MPASPWLNDMKLEQTEVDRDELAAFIDTHWCSEHWPGRTLSAAGLSFIPLGEDSHCYELRPDTGEPLAFFARLEPARNGSAELDAVAERLETAARVCAVLATQPTRLAAAVVAPLRTAAVGGEHPRFVAQLPPFAIVLFEKVEGQQVMPPDDDGSWVAATADRTAAAALVGLLHGSCKRGVVGESDTDLALDSAVAALGEEDFSHRHAAGIKVALTRAKTEPDSIVPEIERETCALLRESEPGITWLLTELERLRLKFVSEAQGGDLGFVLTHQEPHLANFCAAEGTPPSGTRQLRLVDWGDIKWGPPERDLFALLGDARPPGIRKAVLDAYLFARFESRPAGAEPAATVRPEMLRWYELRWVAQEIDDYASRILNADHTLGGGLAARDTHTDLTTRAQEQERCLVELKDYLPVNIDGLRCSICGVEAEAIAAAWVGTAAVKEEDALR